MTSRSHHTSNQLSSTTANKSFGVIRYHPFPPPKPANMLMMPCAMGRGAVGHNQGSFMAHIRISASVAAPPTSWLLLSPLRLPFSLARCVCLSCCLSLARSLACCSRKFVLFFSTQCAVFAWWWVALELIIWCSAISGVGLERGSWFLNPIGEA